MYTVLLIEDQFDVASMLRLMLSRKGHRALVASSIAEATGIWNAYKEEIHLVLTDNALPDGSGVSFAIRIAQEKPELKVIVASGIPVADLPVGFHRIDKPFEFAELLDVIKEAFGKPPDK